MSLQLRTIFCGNLKKPWEVLIRKKKKKSYEMAFGWDGFRVTRNCLLSQDFFPVLCYCLISLPCLVGSTASVLSGFPFYSSVLSPDATPHNAQYKMIISEMKTSSLWWSLPCNEKTLRWTPQSLNKATYSMTQCHLTESDLCQKAGWGCFLFYLLLSWQQDSWTTDMILSLAR